MSGHLITVSTKREVTSYKISGRSSSNVDVATFVPFSAEVESVANTTSTSSAHDSALYNPINIDFARDIEPGPGLQALTVDRKLMISCGYWDNSFKVLSVDGKQLLQSVNQHRGTVTCLAVGLDGTTLVTGSRDTTLMVWTLSGNTDRGNKAPPVLVPPRLTLFGHDDEVSAVAVNCELDVVVSGGNDGSVLPHVHDQRAYVHQQ